MTVEVKGDNLVITLPMLKPIKLSGSGKSKVLATTNGNKVSDLEFDGKKIVIGVNAYIPVN